MRDKLFFELSSGRLIKHGETVCGDEIEHIKLDEDIIMVLADGLGSGASANSMASTCAQIVSSLFADNYEIEDVMTVLSTVLPKCYDRGIAYSTFTCVRLSPNGMTRIIEYDNPECVIIRKGQKLPLERIEHFIGDKRVTDCRVRLMPDDYLIFFTDGVVHAGVGKLLNLGWRQHNVERFLCQRAPHARDAREMREALLYTSQRLYLGEPGDDTSAIVCRARRENIAYVMVGPPADKASDEYIVRDFLSYNGVKVVCGGTTAGMVSRVSNRPLTASLHYEDVTIPPTGSIPGIDLVTEGIITLRRTLELLEKYSTRTIFDDPLPRKYDGASLLAHLLAVECTGARIILGQAMNPAYYNPELHVSFDLKFKLIESIGACLARMGKDVKIEYH